MKASGLAAPEVRRLQREWARPKDAKKLIGCGTTKFYELLASGKVESVKIDGMRLVDIESINQLGQGADQ